MKIRIPASSANLGPGFDCLGIAWKLYDEIEFQPGADSLRITGCPEAYRNRENLCFYGYAAALKRRGLPERPVAINFLKSDIPISRGLGSSAALITGGVLAADRLWGLRLTKNEILKIVSEAEGQPDNAAASLFGGFTASAVDGGKVVAVKFKVSTKLHFTALIPEFQLSTKIARSVLPDSLTREDAIFNISRSAFLIKAMESGDTALLATALRDRIHQPYRLGLIEGYEGIKRIALGLGCDAICISGAGPALLCISGSEGLSKKISPRMAESFPKWRVLPLIPDFEGAAVI